MSAASLKNERMRLVRYLARGGQVMREKVGGVIGVRCCGAATNGREFNPLALERLLDAGAWHKGERLDVFQVGGVAGEIFAGQLVPNTAVAHG